ncbi:MAG: hypothetical protein ACR2JO_01000 [Mycobacteriales bacterium]
MTCWDYGGTNHYLDPGSVLWARQVSSSVTTGDSCGAVVRASSANDLVVGIRPGGNYCLVDPGAAGSEVGGAAVSAGTWVTLGVEGELYANFGTFGPGDWLRCTARDVTHNKVIDPAAAAWVTC